MTKVMWVFFNDAGCLYESVPSVDRFDGVEGSTPDGPGSVIPFISFKD